ncbi:MAG TPA: hypothetical protein ENJ18_00225 [Nannocystis exedens]|nr:hypothetical protein [Nannocystis exedens]
MLGTSHLSGDPLTVRADLADTIALRRRKGTLGAIERLVYDLSGYGVHAVELRERLVWAQHLAHLRLGPSAAGPAVIRGGTVALRDPAMLSLLGTPFDSFARVPDLKSADPGVLRPNLPNLAIFLWRLQTFTTPLGRPVHRGTSDLGSVSGGARFVVRFDIDPLGRPLCLFGRRRESAGDFAGDGVTDADSTPGPILRARLTSGSSAGVPTAYVALHTYDASGLAPSGVLLGSHALTLHLPDATFGPLAPTDFSFWGVNLCAWEEGLPRALGDHEIAIDPAIGRLAIGLDSSEAALALEEALLCSPTYGAFGPVGAHPIVRDNVWAGAPLPPAIRVGSGLEDIHDALAGLADLGGPRVIELAESAVFDLDLSSIVGTVDEDGGPNLMLTHSLVIRAADGQRPILRLAQPLRLRPAKVVAEDASTQGLLDDANAAISLRIEGILVTRGPDFPAGPALIERAAVGAVEIVDATLDPGGYTLLSGLRAPIEPALRLREPYGFSDGDDEQAFAEIPEITIRRSITGPLLLDPGYRLRLLQSIVDAGSGVDTESAAAAMAIAGATPSATGDPVFAAPTSIDRATIFGRARLGSLHGSGVIFCHRLEVQEHQRGCLRLSYVAGEGDLLPPNLGCVAGINAHLAFASERVGDPGYAQVADRSDRRIRTRGPGDDVMGAFAFLLPAHAWKNLEQRLRETMPVGMRPLLIPVT